MPLLTRRSLLLAKIQASKGANTTLAANADAFLVSDLDVGIDPNVLERNNYRPSLSQDAVVVGRKLATVTFNHELKGSGVGGIGASNNVDPKLGALLRACGFQKVQGTNSVDYTPVSTGFEYMTLEVYYDGTRHRITDALGTFSLTAEAGGYVSVSFTFTGNYVEPTDVSFPSGATYESTLPPVVEISSFSLLGYSSFAAQSFNIDLSAEIVPIEDINKPEGYDGVLLTGRTPTGSVNPEAVLIASHNIFANLAAGTTGVFTATVGQSVDNQCVISAPAAQVSNVTYGDRNGLRVYDLALRFNAGSGAGDDELKFSFTQTP